MVNFSVGDRVITTKEHDMLPAGSTGTVMCVKSKGQNIAIDFDKDIDFKNFHPCGRHVKRHSDGNYYGYWVYRSKLKHLGGDHDLW